MSIKFEEDTDFRLKLSLRKNTLIAGGIILLLLVVLIVSGVIYIYHGYGDMKKSYLVIEENSLLKEKRSIWTRKLRNSLQRISAREIIQM